VDDLAGVSRLAHGHHRFRFIAAAMSWRITLPSRSALR
jgi:hypothetical protein